eukprot:g31897.t1
MAPHLDVAGMLKKKGYEELSKIGEGAFGKAVLVRSKEGGQMRQNIPESQILCWFTQAMLALKYIHERHVLHRDLKPGNFFINNGALKMGDFGIAKARTQIGTPYYLSPEVCDEEPYAWPSDIWAMGCILFELCALKVPFEGPNIHRLVQRILMGSVPLVPGSYSEFVRRHVIRNVRSVCMCQSFVELHRSCKVP